MNKATLLILFIILVGCAESNTAQPEQDAGFANVAAITTQTAVSQIFERTRIAQTATRQHITIQQTAVSYDLTSTSQAIIAATATQQVIQTAVIATETALYAPVALRQTEDAQSILMARQSVDSTATAVYMTAQIEDDKATRVRKAEWWTIAQWGAQVLLFVVGAFGAVRVYRTLNPHLPVEDGNGNIIAVDKGLSQLPRPRQQRQLAMANVIPNIPEPRPPESNMGTKPVTWNTPRGSETIEVSDNNPDVTDHEWRSFANAVLVNGHPPTRRGLKDQSFISQSVFNRIYKFMVENDLVSTGVGDAMIIDKANGYQYLYNKLDQADRENVTLPHPSGATPSEHSVNQPTN